MRKTRLMIVLSLLLAACCMVGGFVFLKQSEKLDYGWENIYGDISEADGIEINGLAITDWTACNLDKVLWNIQYSVTGSNVTMESEAVYDEGINLQSQKKFVIGLSGSLKDYNNLYHEAAEKYYEEKAKNGVYENGHIPAKDIFEYMPICGLIEIGDYYSVLLDSSNAFDIVGYDAYDESSDMEIDGELLKDYNDLSEFFKIPMPEDAVIYGEAIAPDEDNKYYTFSRYAHISWSWDKYFESVFSDNYIFIYFDNSYYPLDGEATKLDTSLIPGGYGIYRLPYEISDKESEDSSNPYTQLYTEDLINLYPIDENVEILTVSYNESDNTLFVFTIEDGHNYVTIIDAETGKEIRKIGLFDEEIDFIQTYMGEGYCIIREDVEDEDYQMIGQHITVLSREEDGIYSVKLDYILNEEDYTAYINGYGNLDDGWNSVTCMTYKDGKLAVLCQATEAAVPYEYSIEDWTYSKVNFVLMIFDGDKLSYMGKFTNSLSEADYLYYGSYSATNWEQSFNEVYNLYGGHTSNFRSDDYTDEMRQHRYNSDYIHKNSPWVKYSISWD